jgi:hypothetical protein
MRRPWRVVVVRVWRLDHRRIVRMTLSSAPDRRPRTAYLTSSRSAADRLFEWLEEASDADAGRPAKDADESGDEP